MHTVPIPFDSDAAQGEQRPIVRRNPLDPSETEMVEAVWGSDPRFGDGASFKFVRAEGQTFPARRCLVAASEFQMGVGKTRYRVTLESGNHFYLAAIWSPPMADWPLSFRIITVPANPEVSPHQARHGAIIQRRQVMQWLDATVPEADLLVTPPARTFIVESMGADTNQPALAF